MAETGQQRAVTAAFPPPPPFWKHFTSANLEKLEEFKKEASSKDNNKENKKIWSPADLRSLQLPPELRYLVPPEPPQSGFYNLFGEAQNVCRINSSTPIILNVPIANSAISSMPIGLNQSTLS